MRLPGTKSSLAAGLAAAIGASICCVGPLVLLGLGIGGAWVADLTALEPARPLLAIAALAFLALAFRGLHFAPARCEPGEACADPGVRRRQRAMFWLVGLVTVALLAAPWAAALAADAPAPPHRTETLVLDVGNMTCPLCPITVRKALERVPGVEAAKVDYAHETATVTFEADKVAPAALVKATTDAGYPSRPRP